MYKLLIVDDEPIIADGLKELLITCDELELDVEVAYHAVRALSIMEKERIDIVISDIRMPGTNGIEFAKSVQLFWPLCKIIFLTGYKHSDYTLAAIRCNVVDYVLKTESDESIITAVKKAIRLLKHEVQGSASEPQQDTIHQVRAALLNEQIFSLNHSTPEDCIDRIFFETPIDSHRKVLLLLGKVDWRADCAQKQLENILSFIQKTMSGYFNQYFCIHDGLAVWLFQMKSGLPQELEQNWKEEKRQISYIQNTMEILMENMSQDEKKIPVSFTIYSKSIRVCDISRCYSELMVVLNKINVLGGNAVLSELAFSEEPIMLKDAYELYMPLISELPMQLRQLLQYLEEGRCEEYFKLFDRITRPFLTIKYMTFPIANEVYLSIAYELLHYINVNRLVEKIAFSINPVDLTDIRRYNSWDEAISVLRRVSSALLELNQLDREENSVGIMKRLKEYIGHNLNGDLSLNRLAEQVNLNPFYLSRCFKELEGENISAYIEELKFEQAKSLLRDTQLKILEIATMLGFESPSYFTMRFRKRVGMSPQAYRDMKNE